MNFNNNIKLVFYIFLLPFLFISTNLSFCYGFPIYAQQSYDNPRDATGRIVCANCHLAQKPIKIEAPQAVLPNSIFEATVKIPYNNNNQILGDGTKGPLNVGAVVILPEGFKLAPKSQIPKEIQVRNKGIYIQPYSKLKNNILVVGPVSGEGHQEIIFPIVAPDPAINKNIHFLKYPIYAGGNRGRGQLYPSGDKSNNNIITASTSGKINTIEHLENGGFNIEIQDSDGNLINNKIPMGMNIRVAPGDPIKLDQALTTDPNIGGFGQNETEIILQNPRRIKGMIVFFLTITFAQIFFVLKKKQFEKVQASEINF